MFYTTDMSLIENHLAVHFYHCFIKLVFFFAPRGFGSKVALWRQQCWRKRHVSWNSAIVDAREQLWQRI
jgi:hypothetical protein